MRIVSGIYGGRKLNSPDGDKTVRPTSDKVRGAIFNALFSRVDLDGARVMDAFCGSGALGLEALSRGVEHCVFVDANRTSLSLAQGNADMLSVPQENVDFVRGDVCKMRPCTQGTVDLLFMDPPYDKGLVLPALESLRDGGWLAAGCMCVVEVEKRFSDMLPAMYVLDSEKTYGSTRVLYLRYQVET